MNTLEQILQIASETKGQVDLLVKQGAIQDERHSALEARVRAVEEKQGAYKDDRALAMEGRLSKVENRQHWYAGVAAAVGWGFGYVVKGLTGHG